MDATELGRWTRFAAKGGIGKCTAVQDCVAEHAQDLMFLKDDEITVLMQIPGQIDLYLGYCEGVVGNFHGGAVEFHGRLKKPVLTKRQSSASPVPRPPSSQSPVAASARDAPSPAIPPIRDLPPAISATPSLPVTASQESPPTLAPSVSSSTISAVPASPPDSPPPERSLSHQSQETPTPVTPADGNHDEPSIVLGLEKEPLVPPDVASKLATAVEHLTSPDSTMLPLPPVDRASSVYSDSDSNPRLSIALSDNGVGNIGLSLLQDFVGGDGDGDDVDSGDDAPEIRRVQSPESLLEDLPSIARSVLQPLPNATQPPLTSRSDSFYSQSPRSVAQSLSATDDYNSGEDWEGADDIYDQYRYSRFSVASKMSHLSKGSMQTFASGSDAPPIPAERPSLDSNSGRDRKGSKGKVPSRLTESTTLALDDVRYALEDEPSGTGGIQKNRPAPLMFAKDPEPSPLLRATFGSPQAFPNTAPSATSGGFGSPTLMSPVYPTQADAATSHRKREHDEEFGSNGKGNSSKNTAGLQPGQVVIVDNRDDSVPMTAVSQVAEIVNDHVPVTQPSQSTLLSEESSAAYEKRALANAEPTVDQPPPPPYSVSATPVPVHTFQAPNPATSPPPGGRIVIPPPGHHPQSRPTDPNRLPVAAQTRRQSLFMPHPGAPKPADTPAGPMYGRQIALNMPPLHAGPPPGSIHHILGMAFAARREGRPAPPTIYARFEYDLSSSMGPVPITFGVEPQNNVPANRPVRPPMPWVPPSRTTSPASQLSGRRSATSPPAPVASPPIEQVLTGQVPGQPIPRTNFAPRLHAARPRSRSFSGLSSGDLAMRRTVLGEGSRDDASAPAMASTPLSSPLTATRPLAIATKRSKSAMATTTTVAANVPAPQRATVSHSSTVVRGLQRPSPLSLSQNNVVAPPVRSPPPRASTNPLPAPSPLPADFLFAGAQVTRALSLDQAVGAPLVTANGLGLAALPKLQSPLATLPETLALNSSPPASPRSAMDFPPLSSPQKLRHSRSAILSTSSKAIDQMPGSPRARTASQSQSESRPSADTVRSAEGTMPRMMSPSEENPEGGTLGLSINKRSEGRPQMAPLRLVTSNQSAQELRSPTLSVSTSELMEQDTVQVQDTDFEIVKPTIPLSPFAGSFDSLPSPARADGLLRTDSPALSVVSGSSHFVGESRASAISPSEVYFRPLNGQEAGTAASTSHMEAHRQRELRWVSLMSSVPASQSRKSKKIRKMVLEGVPASVRYQVWATLTDSKGKRMEGVYQKLAQREKVVVYAEIERDIQQSLREHPQLLDGSLAKLLHAYLCMVPDVQYSRGLAMVAGQLLLQSPEEDAFWTFVSLMDIHLRPYFSSSSVRLEVDASLFARALEANDAAAAKKVFGDMGIAPTTVCRAWFTTVFVDALPPNYLARLWDVFLFEGVSFLFRAGLAIFSCIRRILLQSSSQEGVLNMLYHPPPSMLPPSPYAFIELAFSVKLKAEDLRKQRSKLEAQVKRRTAQTRPSQISPSPHTISLPKNGM